MEIARKISIGGINGVRKGFKDVKETQFVARVMGIAHSAKQEEGNLGAYWKFTGEFQAVNQAGEITAAPVIFLPAPADEMLAAAVKAADAPVKFGFDISIEPREDVAIGYAYRIKPLLEVKPSNPLADLLAEMPALPALPNKTQSALALEAPAEAGNGATETPAETAVAETAAAAPAAAKGKARK